MKKRFYFWDNYKGILIFLVVLGHFLFTYSLKLGPETLADNLNTFIHMFHMPAFVFCSGYLSKSENSRSKSSVFKLILYYLIFNTVMFIYKYFVGGSSGKLLSPHQTLWYLLSLISWRLIITDVSKIKGIIPITILITLLCGFWNELGTDILSIRRTIAFFIYFLLGYKMDKEYIEHFLENRSRKTFILGVLLTLVFIFVLTYIIKTYNSHFPIASSLTYKPYNDAHNVYTRIFYIIVACISILLMFMIIPNKEIPILTKWGKNSLTIFLCHRIITLEFDKLFPYKTFQPEYYVYIFAASILTCLVLGSDKLTTLISKNVDSAAQHMLDDNDEVGDIMKTILMLVLTLIMALVPYINSIR